jgi:hypothetical protein
MASNGSTVSTVSTGSHSVLNTTRNSPVYADLHCSPPYAAQAMEASVRVVAAAGAQGDSRWGVVAKSCVHECLPKCGGEPDYQDPELPKAEPELAAEAER